MHPGADRRDAGRPQGTGRLHRWRPRERARLARSAARAEAARARRAAAAYHRRWCTRVLEGRRRGLAENARAALLGAQDRERARQAAEEPAAESQTRVAGNLDGRNQGRRRTGVRRLHRELHAQIREGGRLPEQDRDTLLAFHDFPAEHWKHLRTTNPIESTFATVRHRRIRSKGCLSNRTALAMVFKLLEAAQKSWRRLDGHNQLPKLVLGVTFNNGIEVIAKPTDRQPTTAAA